VKLTFPLFFFFSFFPFPFPSLQADRALMVGISQQQTYPDLSYTRISYAVYLRSDGMLGVYESGRSVYFMNVPYAANQEIVIRVSGSAVEYAIEGQVEPSPRPPICMHDSSSRFSCSLLQTHRCFTRP
jgi:hypothetical protein